MMIAKENVRVKLIHIQNIIGTTAIGTLTSTHLNLVLMDIVVVVLRACDISF